MKLPVPRALCWGEQRHSRESSDDASPGSLPAAGSPDGPRGLGGRGPPAWKTSPPLSDGCSLSFQDMSESLPGGANRRLGCVGRMGICTTWSPVPHAGQFSAKAIHNP
jgi:hypothetical protein